MGIPQFSLNFFLHRHMDSWKMFYQYYKIIFIFFTCKIIFLIYNIYYNVSIKILIKIQPLILLFNFFQIKASNKKIDKS